MTDSLPPLPDDLAALFAKSNAAPENAELLASLRARVSRAMVLRGVPGFDAGDPSAPEVPSAPASAAVAKGLLMKVAALAASGGLAVGLAVGHEWGARKESAPRAAPAVSVASVPTASVTAAPSSAPLTVDALPSAPVIATSATSATRVARPVLLAGPSGSADDGAGLRSALRRERELVDGASGALRSGNAAQALALSDQAARQFSQGQLAEEREVIAIEALLALGRRAEAESRLDRFRTAFPRSPAAARLLGRLNSPPP